MDDYQLQSFADLIDPLHKLLIKQQLSIIDYPSTIGDITLLPPTLYHGVYSFHAIPDEISSQQNLEVIRTLLSYLDKSYPQRLLQFPLIPISPSSTDASNNREISVLQFNMLADNLSGGDPKLGGFDEVDPTCLDISTRKWRILHTILQALNETHQTSDASDGEYGATSSSVSPLTSSVDVVCIQELDLTLYRDFFGPIMGYLGYQSVYRSKLRPTVDNRPLYDGCGIFSRFPITSVWWVPLLVDTNNIALMVSLEIPPQPSSTAGLSTNTGRATPVIIATTHLKSTKSEMGEIVRAKQLSLALSYISHFRAYHSQCYMQGDDDLQQQLHPLGNTKDYLVPTILTGDFNAAPYPTPSSSYPPYAFSTMLLQGIKDLHGMTITPLLDGGETSSRPSSNIATPKDNHQSTPHPSHPISFYDCIDPSLPIFVLKPDCINTNGTGTTPTDGNTSDSPYLTPFECLPNQFCDSFRQQLQQSTKQHTKTHLPHREGKQHQTMHSIHDLLIELIQLCYLYAFHPQRIHPESCSSMAGGDSKSDQQQLHHTIEDVVATNTSKPLSAIQHRLNEVFQTISNDSYPSIDLRRFTQYISLGLPSTWSAMTSITTYGNTSHDQSNTPPTTSDEGGNANENVHCNDSIDPFISFTDDKSRFDLNYRLSNAYQPYGPASHDYNKSLTHDGDSSQSPQVYAPPPPPLSTHRIHSDNDEQNKDNSNILTSTNAYSNAISPYNEFIYGPFTTIKTRRQRLYKHPLDYVLFTREISACDIGAIPSLADLPSKGLPHHSFPSDHLPLFARLSINLGE